MSWTYIYAGEDGGIHIPRAMGPKAVLFLPPSRCVFVDVPLPKASAGKRAKLLPFAVEDELAGEVENSHVVEVRDLGDGKFRAAVVEREWLAGLVREVGILGHEVRHATPLPMGLPWEEGEWQVFWEGHGGWLRYQRDAWVALDDGAPPYVLRSLMKKGGANRVVCYLAAAHLSDQVAGWAASLPAPVSMAQGSVQETVAAAGVTRFPVELMQGGFRPVNKSGRAWSLFKPAAAFAALWLVLLFAGKWLEVAELKGEHRAMQEQMRGLFLNQFPGSVVVDPVLQVQRKLEEARQQSGVVAEDDFLALLSKAAPHLPELQKLRYGEGALEVRPAGAAGPELAALLQKQGLQVADSDGSLAIRPANKEAP